jgi:hypothetical protein
MGRPLRALELTAQEWEQVASFGASCSLPHALVARAQNRNGLIAAATATHADGYAERSAALLMLEKKQQGRARRISVGGSRLTTGRIVRTVRKMNVTPHIIRNDRNRSSNLYHRTTRQPGYAISLSRRWLIEKGFGWPTQTGPLRQVKQRRLEKVDWPFVFSCAAHNLLRLPRLMVTDLLGICGCQHLKSCSNRALRSVHRAVWLSGRRSRWAQPAFKHTAA